MSYCNNCGQQLNDNAKFCSKCGTPVNFTNYSKRRVVYEGETHQCPQCGEVLDSFISQCPTCKYELRDIRGSIAIRELAEKLEKATSKTQQIIIEMLYFK